MKWILIQECRNEKLGEKGNMEEEVEEEDEEKEVEGEEEKGSS